MNTIWTAEEAKNSSDSLLENVLSHHQQIIQLDDQQKLEKIHGSEAIATLS